MLAGLSHKYVPIVRLIRHRELYLPTLYNAMECISSEVILMLSINRG